MDGCYLICPTELPDDPEIFLLLSVDEEQIGICVNREFRYSSSSAKEGPLKAALNLTRGYGSKWCFKGYQKPVLPILDGGKAKKGLFILHNAFSNAEKSSPYSKMYTISFLQDFIDQLISGSVPTGYIQVVHGFRRFQKREIHSNLMLKKWELRHGMHAMAYGPNLEQKVHYIDLLTKQTPSEVKAGSFDMGSMMNNIMNLTKEVQPSIMHSSIIGFLQTVDPESSYETHFEVVRMMVAVGDTEGNDIIGIMKKYTHVEDANLYDQALEDGFNFDILEKFDRRISMLQSLGLDPLVYDYITSDFFLNRKQSKTKGTPSSGRLSGLEDAIRKVAAVVKAREVSGEKG